MTLPVRRDIMGTAAGLLLLAASDARGEDGPGAAARALATAAARAGIERMAVLPFSPLDSSDPREGRILSERLSSSLAGRRGIRLVERSLLPDVLEEHSLASTGLLEAAGEAKLGRFLRAQAVVSGTFLDLGARIEVYVRLIETGSAAVLAAERFRLRRDWDLPALPSAPLAAEEDLRDAPASVPALPAPDCADARLRADLLEESVLELKARYWATEARAHGLPLDAVSARLASRIPERLRDPFDSLLLEYAAVGGPPLDKAELRRFAAVDGAAFELHLLCLSGRGPAQEGQVAAREFGR